MKRGVAGFIDVGRRTKMKTASGGSGGSGDFIGVRDSNGGGGGLLGGGSGGGLENG